MAVVTFKVHVFVDDLPDIIQSTLPPALAHLSKELRIWADGRNKELLQYVSATHMRFAKSLVHAIGYLCWQLGVPAKTDSVTAMRPIKLGQQQSRTVPPK